MELNIIGSRAEAQQKPLAAFRAPQLHRCSTWLCSSQSAQQPALQGAHHFHRITFPLKPITDKKKKQKMYKNIK